MEIPFNVFDGAENGLINFIANISPGYNLFSTTLKASGGDSYHFTHVAPADQIPDLNQTLLAQANSAVQFSSLLGYATPGQVAKVQVSTNAGAAWQDVYSQAGAGSFTETVFSPRQVSLAAFAGQTGVEFFAVGIHDRTGAVQQALHHFAIRRLPGEQHGHQRVAG